MRVAYVLAAWGGSRREGPIPPGRLDPDEAKPFDPTELLRGHFAHLDSLDHDAQVILMVPRNDRFGDRSENAPGYDDLIGELSERPDVRVHHRPNGGYSYGSWSDAFGLYRDEFDVYLFYEDDYWPIGHHFDRTWVELLDQAGSSCGYLCGWYAVTGGHPPHAAVSIGAATTASLSRVWEVYGCLPHSRRTLPGLWKEEWSHSQVGFSRAFIEVGLSIQGIVEFGYRSPFWNAKKKELMIFEELPETNDEPCLFFPAQAWDDPTRPPLSEKG